MILVITMIPCWGLLKAKENGLIIVWNVVLMIGECLNNKMEFLVLSSYIWNVNNFI